jgi:hypothetical protein
MAWITTDCASGLAIQSELPSPRATPRRFEVIPASGSAVEAEDDRPELRAVQPPPDPREAADVEAHLRAGRERGERPELARGTVATVALEQELLGLRVVAVQRLRASQRPVPDVEHIQPSVNVVGVHEAVVPVRRPGEGMRHLRFVEADLLRVSRTADVGDCGAAVDPKHPAQNPLGGVACVFPGYERPCLSERGTWTRRTAAAFGRAAGSSSSGVNPLIGGRE